MTFLPRSCCFCDEFDTLACNKALKKHALLNDLSRYLKYFDDVELVFPSDKFQIFSIFNMFKFIFNPMIHVTNTKLWIKLKHVEDPTFKKIVRHFCFYSASTKTNFGFCSCSELLKLKLGKKKRRREIQIPQPSRQLRG